MSSSVSFQTKLQVIDWSKKTQKQLTQDTPWGQLSGTVNKTNPLGNGEMDTVPEACIFKKTMTGGGYKTVIPWQGKINTLGKFGKQTLLGDEASIAMKQKEIHYGVERQAISVDDESIDGDFSKFYAIGSQKTGILETYIAELDDYNYARAFLEGGSYALTENDFWATTSLGSAPVTKRFHSKWYIAGASSLPTWDSTYATFETAIDDALDARSTSDVADLQTLESIALLASRNIAPIKNGMSDNDYRYVAMVSDEFIYQITSGASNAFQALFKDAAERGTKNKAITGAVGMYRGVLYVVNQRQPVWNLASAAGSKVSYRTPAVNSTTRVVKGTANAGTGTMELTFVMGKGAIGVAEREGVKYVGEKTDYEFNDGFAVQRKIGVERMEFYGSATTTEPTQEASFVYATPTNTQAY